MHAWTRFFISPQADVPLLHGHHHLGLVALSIGVAILCAGMALQVAGTARLADTRRHRQMAIAAGSIALAGGTWTMHFIGMMSYRLPLPVSYDPWLTVLSMLPAWAASWLALHLLVRNQTSPVRLLGGGMMVGLGIGAMHYSGMAAMQMDAHLLYDAPTFALSLLVAMVLAVLALWVLFGLRAGLGGWNIRLPVSAVILGLAISSMHFTGMAAVRIVGVPQPAETLIVFDEVWASLMLSCFTLTLAVVVVAANGMLRYRQIVNALRRSELRHRAIVETAVDGIITIDCRGIVQDMNASSERLFGWSSDEVVGRNIKMLMPEPDQSRHDDYLRNYLSTGVAKIIGSGREITGLHKDGSLLPMRLAVGQVNLPGEPLFVGFLTDISGRRALESSLREAAKRAEHAAEAKSSFLANMSHEIRTPMNAIIGFTELLLEDELPDRQRKHLNTVRQSARSLLGLLNDILDVTKMEREAFRLEKLTFSLKAVCAQVVASLRLSAEAKGLQLSWHYPDTLPEYYVGDPLRIQQILTNLLSNAIKFTERGSVDLTLHRVDQDVHMQIRDTGIGMSQEQLGKLFDPFSQADVSISRRFGGTGLGTTIARQLVDLMGGCIHVDSALGRGTVFQVTLPLPRGDARAVLPDEQALQLPPLRVLVVDDVQQNVELLSLTLGEAGHWVETAFDGEQAVQAFMAQRFDIVLMDVHMPNVDGREAARRIRAYERDHELAAVPIVALTASVMESDRRAAREAGMDGFAVKPLEVLKLKAEMARVLGLSAAAARSQATPYTEPVVGAPVDWSRGVRVWGSPQRMARAVGDFLRSTADRLAPYLNATDGSQILASALLHDLHSIHGAAGNLALPVVAQQARIMEQQLRKDEQALPQVLQQVEALQGALAAVSDELQSMRQLLASERAAGAQSAEVPVADVQAQVRQLHGMLQRGQFDDDALQAVYAHLEQLGEPTRFDALVSSVETFEFEQAQRLLEAWFPWLTHSNPDSPLASDSRPTGPEAGQHIRGNT